MWGILGRAAGVLGGIMWPSDIDPGVPTEKQRADELLDVLELPQLGRILEVHVPRVERRAPLPTPAPATRTVPNPLQGPPTPVRQPAPVSQTPPQPSTMGIGAPEVFQPVLSLPLPRSAWTVRSRSTPGSQTLTPGAPIPASPFAPPTTTTSSPPRALPTSPFTPPLTGVETGPVTSSSLRIPTRTPTRTRECQCEPKRRKKQRKCLARAPLVWAGGPKKGKPAGTRCIRRAP